MGIKNGSSLKYVNQVEEKFEPQIYSLLIRHNIITVGYQIYNELILSVLSKRNQNKKKPNRLQIL